jgi:hypothetical protein
MKQRVTHLIYIKCENRWTNVAIVNQLSAPIAEASFGFGVVASFHTQKDDERN